MGDWEKDQEKKAWTSLEVIREEPKQEIKKEIKEEANKEKAEGLKWPSSNSSEEREFKNEKRKNNLELFALKQTRDFDSFLSKFQELADESSMAQEDLILIFLIHLLLLDYSNELDADLFNPSLVQFNIQFGLFLRSKARPPFSYCSFSHLSIKSFNNLLSNVDSDLEMWVTFLLFGPFYSIS
ncbi:hypothetical protein BpHYR1_014265 [Brachionus plicatilis]|uniref:Uncharacterized protein n=1 Tax=Brachionus plicatilis TaxID=10195 RepID=A0A3M7SVJ6_BRAPC|nr:hypothetical protein BpHYR1_014265 [Brachionus plicatilis]